MRSSAAAGSPVADRPAEPSCCACIPIRRKLAQSRYGSSSPSHSAGGRQSWRCQAHRRSPAGIDDSLQAGVCSRWRKCPRIPGSCRQVELRPKANPRHKFDRIEKPGRSLSSRRSWSQPVPFPKAKQQMRPLRDVGRRTLLVEDSPGDFGFIFSLPDAGRRSGRGETKR